jgi:hypothetical protein
MMIRTRKSVPTAGMHQWWLCGWSYIMPDFDNKDHSIIEWFSDKAPVEPSNRVPVSTTAESAENGHDRRQQPA